MRIMNFKKIPFQKYASVEIWEKKPPDKAKSASDSKRINSAGRISGRKLAFRGNRISSPISERLCSTSEFPSRDSNMFPGVRPHVESSTVLQFTPELF